MKARRGSAAALVLLAGITVGTGLGAALGAESPLAVSPGDTSKPLLVADVCPTFNWGAVDGANFYELAVTRIEEDGEVAAVVLRQALPGSVHGWTPSLDRCLRRGGHYAWFVRAVTDKGPGEWSAPSLFQVAAGASSVELEEALRVVRRYLGEQYETSVEPLAESERVAHEPDREGVAPPSAAAAATALSVDGNVDATSFTGDGENLTGVTTSATFTAHSNDSAAHHTQTTDTDTTCNGVACDGSLFTGVDAELLDGLDSTAFAASLAGQSCAATQFVTGFDSSGNIECGPAFASCLAIKTAEPLSADGVYTIDPDGDGGSPSFEAYCDMTSDAGGWTLVARFANTDAKNWMLDTGEWWYNRTAAAGTPTSRSENLDMLSEAFYSVVGTEIRLSRTDNPTDLGLLVTNSNCLASQTFRAFITSFGNFQNGAPWGEDSVAGTCLAVLGNNSASTSGFSQADCNTHDIGAPNSISFWADWSAGDGSVMMIGGGGATCGRADHGIGITSANAASFLHALEDDFGDDTDTPVDPDDPYALNLWVR